jgi:hypothetical protein
MWLSYYEKHQKEKVTFINAKKKESMLTNSLPGVSRSFDPHLRSPNRAKTNTIHPSDLRMPLDTEYIENRRLARQIFE